MFKDICQWSTGQPLANPISFSVSTSGLVCTVWRRGRCVRAGAQGPAQFTPSREFGEGEAPPRIETRTVAWTVWASPALGRGGGAASKAAATASYRSPFRRPFGPTALCRGSWPRRRLHRPDRSALTADGNEAARDAPTENGGGAADRWGAAP